MSPVMLLVIRLYADTLMRCESSDATADKLIY